MSRVNVSFGSAARLGSLWTRGKASERMTRIASARGSAVSVLVRMSMKRLASSRPSSLNSSSPWSIARRIVGGAAFSPDAARLRDVAQGGEKLRESVVGLLDEVLDIDAAARQAALADAVREARLADDLVERLGEPVLAGDRRALGPDDRQRQPRPVVALEARPQARAQEGRLARSRRAEDDEHARDAGAREPADLVEPAHDLRVAAEKDRRVLLLEIGESGIGPAAGLEGEGRRVEAGALQPLLEAPVGLRVAGEIDELLVGEIERHLRSCRSRRARRSPSCP